MLFFLKFVLLGWHSHNPCGFCTRLLSMEIRQGWSWLLVHCAAALGGNRCGRALRLLLSFDHVWSGCCISRGLPAPHASTVLCSQPDAISAGEAEDEECLRLAHIWVGCARLVAADSSTLCKLRLDDDRCLLPLFVKSAPNTLRR